MQEFVQTHESGGMPSELGALDGALHPQKDSPATSARPLDDVLTTLTILSPSLYLSFVPLVGKLQ